MSAITRFAVLIGMANPMPMFPPDGVKIAVLMPITRPSESNSGPPELPGLMAASVWMTSSISVAPVFTTLRSELMMRSEEHTSELQSLAYLVCRLLLEKKKKEREDAILLFQRRYPAAG